MTCAKKKLDKLGEDERKEFRSTLQSIMKEAKETNAVIKKAAGIVYVDSRDRKYKDGIKGAGWRTTQDPKMEACDSFKITGSVAVVFQHTSRRVVRSQGALKAMAALPVTQRSTEAPQPQCDLEFRRMAKLPRQAADRSCPAPTAAKASGGEATHYSQQRHPPIEAERESPHR